MSATSGSAPTFTDSLVVTLMVDVRARFHWLPIRALPGDHVDSAHLAVHFQLPVTMLIDLADKRVTSVGATGSIHLCVKPLLVTGTN